MAVRLAAHAAEYDPRMIRRVFALTILILALCAVPAFGAAKTPDQVLHTKSSSGVNATQVTPVSLANRTRSCHKLGFASSGY